MNLEKPENLETCLTLSKPGKILEIFSLPAKNLEKYWKYFYLENLETWKLIQPWEDLENYWNYFHYLQKKLEIYWNYFTGKLLELFSLPAKKTGNILEIMIDNYVNYFSEMFHKKSNEQNKAETKLKSVKLRLLKILWIMKLWCASNVLDGFHFWLQQTYCANYENNIKILKKKMEKIFGRKPRTSC